MKRLLQVLLVVVFTASLVLSGCGGGGGSSPESLAKQTYAEFEKAAKADGVNLKDLSETDLGWALIGWLFLMGSEPTPSFVKLNEKIEALSEADKEKYDKALEALFKK